MNLTYINIIRARPVCFRHMDPLLPYQHLNFTSLSFEMGLIDTTNPLLPINLKRISVISL